MLLANLVGPELDLLPGILYVLALAVLRTDGESQEEHVVYLGRYEVDVAGAVDPSQERIVEIVRALRREKKTMSNRCLPSLISNKTKAAFDHSNEKIAADRRNARLLRGLSADT